MGNLPVSRTENCVAGAPVNHNLINEIQDNLIGDNHGTKTLVLGGDSFSVVAGSSIDLSFGDIRGSGGTFEIRATLPVFVGRRITAVRIYVNDNATGPTKLAAALLSRSPTASATVATGSPNPTAGTGADQTITIGPLTTVVASATAYQLKVQTTTGSAQVIIKVAEVDYDNIP